MPGRSIFNSTLAALNLSVKVGNDGNDVQRVEALLQDDTPVAISAGNARFNVSTTTISLSAKLPSLGEEYVWLEAQVNDIAYWDDGKDPAATPGRILSAGYAMRIAKAQFANFKFVRAGTSDAIAVLAAYKANMP